MSAKKPFTKENLDDYLRELAKEFRKRNGNKVPAEIILIGGASILVNYGFRDVTYDVDVIIRSSGVMKDAINAVGDRLSLPTGWMNTDFVTTSSYTPKLIQYSKYYKTFSNILQVRTVSAEYLVAMKLMSGRQYKNDLSDIVGILIEQKNQGDELSFARIKGAIQDLYTSYETVPQYAREFIESVFKQEDLEHFYNKCRNQELDNQDTLLEFQSEYPEVINEGNVDEILKEARKRHQKE